MAEKARGKWKRIAWSRGSGKQCPGIYRRCLLEGCRPQAPAGTDAGAPVPFKPPPASAAYPDRQGDGSYFLRRAPKISTLKPLDRLDFCRAWAAPTAGNRIPSCPAVSPPIVRQNRRYAGRCPAPRPRTKNRIFYRPSSRWRSRRLSCSDMPRIRSALFFAVISSIIFARACFSSG